MKTTPCSILRLLVCLVLAMLVVSVGAEQIKFATMKVGSRVYKNVAVLGVNATDVFFTHSQGISNARLKNLDPELQRLFNYDEEAAEAAERQQMEDNEEFNKQVVSSIETDARIAKESQRRLELTCDESLADPLSETSPIGRALPELKVERWIGDKPNSQGRFQLIFLWAPWSQASKKFLPEMDALEQKLPKEVVCFGLVSEAASDPETDAGVRMGFATGIDPTGKFLEALGVTSLPQVVLVDPKGMVRYLGHPAALNEKRLQELTHRFAQKTLAVAP
jgi:hypothetical protein